MKNMYCVFIYTDFLLTHLILNYFFGVLLYNFYGFDGKEDRQQSIKKREKVSLFLMDVLKSIKMKLNSIKILPAPHPFIISQFHGSEVSAECGSAGAFAHGFTRLKSKCSLGSAHD